MLKNQWPWVRVSGSYSCPSWNFPFRSPSRPTAVRIDPYGPFSLSHTHDDTVKLVSTRRSTPVVDTAPDTPLNTAALPVRPGPNDVPPTGVPARPPTASPALSSKRQ